MADPAVKAMVTHHRIVKNTIITANSLIHEICYRIFRNVSSYPTENIYLHCRDQHVNAVWGNNNLMKNINTSYGNNAKLFSVKANGRYSYHFALKGLQCNVVIVIHLLLLL
jgi:hypothetical protein